MSNNTCVEFCNNFLSNLVQVQVALREIEAASVDRMKLIISRKLIIGISLEKSRSFVHLLIKATDQIKVSKF